MLTVIIVDDDPFVCMSLRTILEAQDDIEVLDVANNGHDAQDLYAKHRPDVLLMDIQMPQSDGLSAGEHLLQQFPDARIVYLTTFADDEYIVRALRLGAKGYLIKQQVRDIAPALRAVVNGQSVLGSEILGRMDKLVANSKDARFSSNKQEFDSFEADPELDALTDREKAIMRAVAQGLDNKEIAADLYLSEGTVRNHISVILQKLDLKNRTQLAVRYLTSHTACLP